MSLTTSALNVRVFYPGSGAPVLGARVQALLSATDVQHSEHVYLIPARVVARTDVAGLAVLDLWPNELGATATTYTITITMPDGTESEFTDVSVPVSATPVELDDIAALPPYAAIDAATQARVDAQAAALDAWSAAASVSGAGSSPWPTGMAQTLSYTDGRLTSVTGIHNGEVWTKNFGYTDGLLSSITIAHGTTAWVKTLTYAAGGLLTNSSAWTLL